MTMLGGTAVGLALGAGLWFAGATTGSDVVWAVTGVAGALYALLAMIDTLRNRRLGVDAIAVLAVTGALVVGEFFAAAVIAVMVASGRALETWAEERARRDLHALLAQAPRVAHRYDDSSLVTVPVDEVEPGELLMVGSGELVPVDGLLVTEAVLDESTLTGEAIPIERHPGDAVRSGVANAGPPLDLRATTSAAQSTYAGIVRLVAEAGASRAPFVRLADEYAAWFLAITLGLAAVVWAAAGLGRGVAVLVVATPCPLILAPPIAFVSGLSRAARRGVVVKSGTVLERLARCTTLLIDKTGTLTSGHPALDEIVVSGALPADEVLARGFVGPGLAPRPRRRSGQRRPRPSLSALVARRRGRGGRAGNPGWRRRPPRRVGKGRLGGDRRSARMGEGGSPPVSTRRIPHCLRRGGR